MKWNIHYGHASVRDFRITEVRRTPSNKVLVERLMVHGQQLRPTRRFWRSFFSRFGIADNVFRYFEPDEVFRRISERASDDQLRYTFQRRKKPKGNTCSKSVEGELLAVSPLTRQVMEPEELEGIAHRYGATEMTYDEGIVTTTHRLQNGDRPFEIGGDRFQHRFVMETPIDGYSHPKIYLSFLREVCSNGMVGYAKAFRSDISLGKDIGYNISRALESYDNGDGYAALRQRFESSQQSWASVHECLALLRVLERLSGSVEAHQQRFRKFTEMTGNLSEIYGLANLDALTSKRQRLLPAKCLIYDLLNFASELATHHVPEQDQRLLQGFVGTIISDEYDLEGTADVARDFSDFFLDTAL